MPPSPTRTCWFRPPRSIITACPVSFNPGLPDPMPSQNRYFEGQIGGVFHFHDANREDEALLGELEDFGAALSISAVVLFPVSIPNLDDASFK